MEHFLATVKETVNPATQPVGVNLVRDISLVDDLKIKVRGKRLAICQQVAYSRMYSWSTWTDAKTSHCAIGAACTGMILPPQRVHRRHGQYGGVSGNPAGCCRHATDDAASEARCCRVS